MVVGCSTGQKLHLAFMKYAHFLTILCFLQRWKSKRRNFENRTLSATANQQWRSPDKLKRSLFSSNLIFLTFCPLVFLQSASPSLQSSRASSPPRSDDVQISPHSSVSARLWRPYRTNSLKHASSCSPRLWCACLSSALAQFQLVRSWVRCWRGPGEGPVGLYQVHLLL